MKNIKIIFAGTPEFALPSLNYFYENFNILAIITKPDKPQGRGLKVKFSPVKEFALKNKITLFQPENLKDEKFITAIKEFNTDFIVDVAYGKIFPPDVLKIPKECCINFHPSLLPGYRGPSPIRWVILNNEEFTGVSSHIMSEKVDSGKIIAQKELPISLSDNYQTLYNKLSNEIMNLIEVTFENYYNNRFIENVSDRYKVKNFYARKIDNSEFKIDWNKNSIDIYNLIRAASPQPGAFTYYKNNMIKIYESEIVNENQPDFKPGEIVDTNIKKGIFVKTNDGILKILKLQMSGRKILPYSEFLKGVKINSKEKFN